MPRKSLRATVNPPLGSDIAKAIEVFFRRDIWALGTGKAGALILDIDLKKNTICFGADKDMHGDF